MPSFSDITSLSKYIKDSLKEVNNQKVAPEMKKQYTKAIQDTVYNAKTEWQTGSLGKSVNTSSRTTKNTSNVKAFIDEKLMTTTYPSWKPDKYGANHQSELPYWMEVGHGGMRSVSGRYYFKLLLTEYFTQSKYKKLVVKELGKLGIQAR